MEEEESDCESGGHGPGGSNSSPRMAGIKGNGW